MSASTPKKAVPSKAEKKKAVMSRCPIFGVCMRKTKTVLHKHGKYVYRITMLRMKNFVVEQNELLSSRICRKCAMKIRNAVPAVLLIHEELNRSLQKSEYSFLHTHPDKEKQETELCKTFEANECITRWLSQRVTSFLKIFIVLFQFLIR